MGLNLPNILQKIENIGENGDVATVDYYVCATQGPPSVPVLSAGSPVFPASCGIEPF